MCHYPVDHAEPIQNSKKYVKVRSKNFEKYSLFFFFFSFTILKNGNKGVGRYLENWHKISERLLLLFTVVIYGILWNTYLTNNLEAHIYGFRHKRHETIIPENFHVKRFPNDRVAMPKKFSSVNSEPDLWYIVEIIF